MHSTIDPLDADGGPEDKQPEVQEDWIGWASIEKHMLKHDTALIKDYSDDVDTLLVFAGLFSAVVTAFVVESYQFLQPDNSDTAVQLLGRVSHQLESFTFNQGLLNSSIPALSSPPIFVPDVAFIWINTLWFLSLLFSLAAALFGILAKQWLREYLKWSAYLASPRENVLVRQIRFEAWNEWNVEASLASIPALLELALVLFVCGLIVFLWTLHPIVAIAFTSAATAFLCAISYLTLLPAFFKRCPYKSPTAWAFTVLVEFVKTAATYLYIGMWWSFRDAAQWRYKHRRRSVQNWRKRDIDSVDISVFVDRRGQRHDALVTVGQATTVPGWRAPAHRWYLGSDTWDTLSDISQFQILIRGLRWAFTASQDKRVDEEIARCASSMHSSSVLANPERWSLSVWYFLAKTFHVRQYHPLPRIWTATEKMGITALRDEVRRSYRVVPFGNHVSSRFCWILATRTPTIVLECHTLADFFIVSHTLAHSLALALQQMLGSTVGSRTQAHLAQTAIDMVAAMCSIWWANAHRIHGDYMPTYVALLVDAYNALQKSDLQDGLDEVFPGLRCSVLQAICLSSDAVTIDESGNIEAQIRPYSRTGPTKDFTSCVSLASQLGTAGSRENQHILATVIEGCLETLRCSRISPPPTPCAILLNTMSDLLELCLLSSTPNGGYYDEIPWLRTLLSLGPSSDVSVAHILCRCAPKEFSRFISLLERSKKARLIVGDGRVDISKLLAQFNDSNILLSRGVHFTHTSGSVTIRGLSSGCGGGAGAKEPTQRNGHMEEDAEGSGVSENARLSNL